jgi:metal-responsive CopG/Arc/MetJ family transcriptional regulator
MRRALVSLPDGIWKVIDNELKGKIGEGDSEVIRNVVISYLNEKGYLLKQKSKGGIPETSVEQIAGEIDMHDTMIESLVEVLEEKGYITSDEWDRRIKKKLQTSNK